MVIELKLPFTKCPFNISDKTQDLTAACISLSFSILEFHPIFVWPTKNKNKNKNKNKYLLSKIH